MKKKKVKYKKELVIDEYFGGQIVYGCMGMRHKEEEEVYYLDKGDKVYIYRKLK